MLELFQKPLSEVPVKMTSIENQKPFVKLVDQILKIYNTNSFNAKASAINDKRIKEIELKLDEMVIDLFGLTKEEREIIQNL